MTKYIGVDFDGTLALHESGAPIDHVGAPIPRMVERVKKWLADGTEVRIITARVAPTYEDADEQRAMIWTWCREHLGVELPVQAHKCGGMSELWDDRAVQVQRNTGASIDEELTEAYNEIFWSVPQFGTLPEKIRTLRQMEHTAVEGAARILTFDREYGVEGDAYADHEREQFGERGGLPHTPNRATIGVYFVTGDPKDPPHYLTPREARCLAASLLREADLAERDEGS